MAKKVKFNFNVLVAGFPHQKGSEAMIDDRDYNLLKVQDRLGVPYVELVEDHTPEETMVEKAAKAPRKKRAAKKKASE